MSEKWSEEVCCCLNCHRRKNNPSVFMYLYHSPRRLQLTFIHQVVVKNSSYSNMFNN